MNAIRAQPNGSVCLETIVVKGDGSRVSMGRRLEDDPMLKMSLIQEIVRVVEEHNAIYHGTFQLQPGDGMLFQK